MMQIKQRNIVVSVILSIVTCGIYGIIWVIGMVKDAIKVKDQNDDGLVEILLSLFLVPVGFYLAEKKFSEGCQMRGINHKDNSTLYIILGFLGLGIVDYCLMQNDLNSLVEQGYAVDPSAGPVPPQQPQYGAPQYQDPNNQPPQQF